mgnify:CR=1 FL=1
MTDKVKDELLKKMAENHVTDDKSLMTESRIYALDSEGCDEFYKNAGSEYNQARAKVMTEKALTRPEFLQTQRSFIKSIEEAASNTSVGFITTYRKLLPEIMARSVNMSLAIENVAQVVEMPTNSMLLALHRRILGANSGTTEAIYNAINSAFGGDSTQPHANTFDPFVDSGDVDTTPANNVTDNFTYGRGNTRVASEDLTFSAMDKVSNRVDQVQLTATSRNVAMSVSTEALQDAQNEYGINLIREGLITMQAELYRAISAELYAKLALIARKETVAFDFTTVGATDADNFYLKNAYLLQTIETMRATIQTETREPGLKFRIIATPRVIARLRMIDRLHVPAVTANAIQRDFDNVSFFRGVLGDYELYEAVNFANNRDFVLVVGKGNTASTSPIIYGNYVPFFLQNIKSPDTTHDLYFGKVRSGMVANPLGVTTFNPSLDLADQTTIQGTCRYARFLRVNGLA